MKNNNFIKTLILATPVLVMIFFADFCSAQTNHIARLADLFKMNPASFREVQFSIALSNIVLRTGSTNYLHWMLRNNSTNLILYEAIGAISPSVPSPVYLTNNDHNYLLIEMPRLPHGGGNVFNSPGAISFLPIDPGKAVEKRIQFVVSGNITVGNYKIVANQFLINTNREGCILTSTLDVKVVK